MTSEVLFKAENRFTLKIIAHRIRKYFPSWFYNCLLLIRFYTFKNVCDDTLVSKVVYSDGSWISRKTTRDLRRIQTYLSKIERPIDVLQIGVGNSSLYRELQSKPLSRMIGITIVSEELDYAMSMFPKDFGGRYKVFIANKYSEEINYIGSEFDYIVDNDIGSYSCCRYHFLKMLENYHSLLKADGVVLIGHDGLKYFDSGFGLTESMMTRIAKRYEFNLSMDEYSYRLKRKN